MEQSLVDFFSDHKRAFLTLHLIGVAVGMGGATITDLLFFNFLKDFTISKKEAGIMRILSNAIMTALFILYVSGGALFLSAPDVFGRSPAFLAKAFILVILTINGVLLHQYIAPHMVEFSFSKRPLQSQGSIMRMRRIAFAMGSISFTSWYVIFLISMLKSYALSGVSTLQIITGYALILCTAMVASQVMHYFIVQKSLVR